MRLLLLLALVGLTLAAPHTRKFRDGGRGRGGGSDNDRRPSGSRGVDDDDRRPAGGRGDDDGRRPGGDREKPDLSGMPDFSGIPDFSGLDFSGLDFSGMDFSGMDPSNIRKLLRLFMLFGRKEEMERRRMRDGGRGSDNDSRPAGDEEKPELPELSGVPDLSGLPDIPPRLLLKLFILGHIMQKLEGSADGPEFSGDMVPDASGLPPLSPRAFLKLMVFGHILHELGDLSGSGLPDSDIPDFSGMPDLSGLPPIPPKALFKLCLLGYFLSEHEKDFEGSDMEFGSGLPLEDIFSGEESPSKVLVPLFILGHMFDEGDEPSFDPEGPAGTALGQKMNAFKRELHKRTPAKIQEELLALLKQLQN